MTDNHNIYNKKNAITFLFVEDHVSNRDKRDWEGKESNS